MRTRHAKTIQFGIYQGKVSLTFTFDHQPPEVLLLPLRVVKALGEQSLALYHEMEGLAKTLLEGTASPETSSSLESLSIEDEARAELWPPTQEDSADAEDREG